MEPRPFDRGNVRTPRPRRPTSTRFNGATAFRPWKQVTIGGNVITLSNASMEPRPFDRGNVAESARLNFLGAASMEPRPFDRGNSGSNFGRCRCRPRFNGATAFRPWKRLGHGVAISTYNELQWSHGLSTVETRADYRHIRHKQTASMEPRPFDRGNRPARA